LRELAEDGGQEVDPLEPPVPEELEVEHGDDDPGGGSGRPRGGRLLEEVAEVNGVRGDPLGRRDGVVELLAVERTAGVRHRPVAKAATGRLPVEFEVRRVARVADVARPDLLGAARVARQDGEVPRFGDDPVDRPGRPPGRRRHSPVPAGATAPAVSGAAGPSGDEVGLDEGEADSALGEEGGDAAPGDPPAEAGRDERPRGPGGALGHPEPARAPPEVAPVRREADVELPLGRRVGGEEREKAVGGGGGDRLDLSFSRHPGEGGDEVPAQGVEERENPLVVCPPRPGEKLGPVAVSGELARVARGRHEPVADVLPEPAREAGVPQLLAEDRRQADRRLPRDPVLVERSHGRQEREVGLGRRLVEPVGAVRPDAVSEDGGNVAVEDEDERDGRRGRLHGRNRERARDLPRALPRVR
jgi:hypothetical protein